MEGHGFPNDKDDQVWWGRLSLIPALERQEQSDLYVFEARLVSIVIQDSPGYAVPVPN